MEGDEILYVLNFRYGGGQSNPGTLERELKELGWKKIANMTSCYVMRRRKGEDIRQNDLSRVLIKHVDRGRPGANVSYGISEYIPPNQRPDGYEGMDTLFDGQ